MGHGCCLHSSHEWLNGWYIFLKYPCSFSGSKLQDLKLQSSAEKPLSLAALPHHKRGVLLAFHRLQGKRDHVGLDKAENPPERHSHRLLSCTQHFRASWKRGSNSHWGKNTSFSLPACLWDWAFPATSFSYTESKLVILFLVKSCQLQCVCFPDTRAEVCTALVYRHSLSQTTAPRVPELTLLSTEHSLAFLFPGYRGKVPTKKALCPIWEKPSITFKMFRSCAIKIE